jgi:hypothetical protein
MSALSTLHSLLNQNYFDRTTLYTEYNHAQNVLFGLGRSANFCLFKYYYKDADYVHMAFI